MISGCSTLGIDGSRLEPVKVAAVCPHPSVFANYATFTNATQVRQGESAFQTVQRFRLAEAEKNRAGRRLWQGMKQCRAKDVPEEKDSGLFGLSALNFGF